MRMGVSYVIKVLALVCAFAWTSSCNEFYTKGLILYHLETTEMDYFSSKDIPISLLKRGVITDKWFTYIDELVSKFGNGHSMNEVLLHLHLNVKRAFHWCKPNMLPTYLQTVSYTNKKYKRIPCGKVVFSKSSTDKKKTYKHLITLAKENSTGFASIGLNLTIHSFISSEHKQYLTGDMIETMCQYVALTFECEHISSLITIFKRYVRCGEIIRKDMIFLQGSVAIITFSKNPNATFQLTFYYQALSLASNVYAAKPIDMYSYNSSSTFYPNLWYFKVPKIEAAIVSLVRWHIKAIIGQNINLVVFKTSECQDDLEAVSIYDGPVKVYDQLVCTASKEPTEPTAQTEPAEPAKPAEPRESSEPPAQTKPAEPAEPREPSEPPAQTEPAEPAEPVEPAEPQEPTEPPAQTEPIKPTPSTEPTAPINQLESIVSLVSYTSTFNSKINYCLNIVQNSHIFFTFEVQSMNSTRIHVEHDQKYQLQVSSGTNAIFYRSWQFTSDSFIRLELAALRHFRGLTYECIYGGMVLNDIGNLLELQYGSICTTYQGYEPLFSTPFWYFNRHGGVLTVYAFYKYFTIDIDLILTSQPCEGITNICSTHCM